MPEILSAPLLPAARGRPPQGAPRAGAAATPVRALRAGWPALWTALCLLWALPAQAAPESDRLTEIAQLLAGIEPAAPSAALAPVTASPAWQAHRRASQAGDRQLKARLTKMNAWQAAHLKPPPGAGSALLYPFSGPDFVNAYALFPDADTYLFFSLEAPGEVPALERLDAKQLEGLFGDLRLALNDLVALNFFITPNMKENLQTSSLQGTVPVLMAMMGLLDLRVERVAPLDPWPELRTAYQGAGARHPALPLAGVQIDFLNPRSGRHQHLEYLALDVSDRELHWYPGFLGWLGSFEKPTVFLKSASYLLHGSNFRQLRRLIRDRAAMVVQDDSGVPYAQLHEAGFRVDLYGQYEQPVKLFENRYQRDLEQAFAVSGNRDSVPFPFGYNWRKDGKSGVIVARRPATGT